MSKDKNPKNKGSAQTDRLVSQPVKQEKSSFDFHQEKSAPQNEIKTIEAEIEDMHKAIADCNRKIEEKQSILSSKEVGLETEIDNFSAGYNIEAEKLSKKIREELEQKSGKQNKEKNPKEAEIAGNLLRELKEIQDETFRQKLNGDMDRSNKEIKRLENVIAQKEKEKEKPASKPEEKTNALGNFLGGKSGQGTIPATPPKTNTLAVPSLPHLPRTGTLYQSNDGTGKNYLAIKDWDEFDDGQKEAERLDATLCAERSDNG